MGYRGLGVFVAAFLLSACSVIKDSKEMKQTLGELNGKGDQLAKRISDVESEGTFEATFRNFVDLTQRLFGENGYDGSSEDGLNSDPDLVEYSKSAIQSLLFQFWKADYADTVATLDDRFALHVDVFFARLNKPIEHKYDVNILNPKRGYKGVGMLGAFLDTMRPEYEDALKKAGLPRLSLYDVIVLALKNRDGGEKTLLPKTQAKVLQWKQEAVHVLQMRHNFLPVLVLGRITNMQDDYFDWKVFGFRSPTLAKFWLMLKGYSFNLNDTNSQMKIDDEQLVLWTEWLNAALETRQTLRDLGFETQYNSAFGSLIKKVDFDQTRILSDAKTKGVTSRRALLEKNFAEAFERVSSEMPKLRLL